MVVVSRSHIGGTNKSLKWIFIVFILLSISLFYINIRFLYQRIDRSSDDFQKKHDNHTTRNNYIRNIKDDRIDSKSITIPLSNRRQQQQQEKVDDGNNNNNLNILPEIIVIGLPKSGTTSIYEFFSCSGYKTSHYCCCGSNRIEYPCNNDNNNNNDQYEQVMAQQIYSNLHHGQSIFTNLGNYTVYAQMDGEIIIEEEEEEEEFTNGSNINNNSNSVEKRRKRRRRKGGYILPQHDYLDEIHFAAPNAIWILNLRPPKDWAKSVMGWLNLASILETKYNKNINYNNNKSIENNDKHYKIQNNQDTTTTAETTIMNSKTTTTEQFLIDFYQKHTNKIQKFVKLHPSQNLIQIDITNDDDTRNILQQSFPNVQSKCWSRHNIGNPFFQVK